MDFQPASFSADEVLQVLEKQMPWFQTLNFEMLEEYTALAGGRLSVFRSLDGLWWVMCIESVYYDARADLNMLGVYLMGNCLRSLQFDEAALERVIFTVPVDVAFSEGHPNYGDIPRREFSILRHGRVLRFAPSEQEYTEAGLPGSQAQEESGAMSPQEMLRFLVAISGEDFFVSEDAVRDLIDARRAEGGWSSADSTYTFCGQSYKSGAPILSQELALFLQTHDWTHPKWDSEDAMRELVPQVEVMRALAEAIASGDLTAWNAQEPSLFNSHWSHWTEEAAQEEWNQQFLNQQLAAQEASLAALDEQLQVLAPDALRQFEQDAQAVIADEDSRPLEVEEVPSETPPELSVCSASFSLWNWNGYMIPTIVLREWLRRRANRSSPGP